MFSFLSYYRLTIVYILNNFNFRVTWSHYTVHILFVLRTCRAIYLFSFWVTRLCTYCGSTSCQFWEIGEKNIKERDPFSRCPLHCPRNNLNLHIKTESEADATNQTYTVLLHPLQPWQARFSCRDWIFLNSVHLVLYFLYFHLHENSPNTWDSVHLLPYFLYFHLHENSPNTWDSVHLLPYFLYFHLHENSPNIYHLAILFMLIHICNSILPSFKILQILPDIVWRKIAEFLSPVSCLIKKLFLHEATISLLVNPFSTIVHIYDTFSIFL